jgi:hypothetical protein
MQGTDIVWEWELAIPQLETSVFILSNMFVKNGTSAWLRSIGLPRQEARHGISPTHVFTYKGKPITRMMTTTWKRACIRAELPAMRVYDEAYLWAPLASRRSEL